VALCQHCAQTLDDEAIVCPACGTPVPLPVPKKRYITGGRETDGALGFGGGCLAALVFFFLDAVLGGAMIDHAGFVAAYVGIQIALLIGLIVYYRKAIRGDLGEAMRIGLITFTICTCVTLGLLAACDGLFINFNMH
jgi:hypothetical protein